MLLITLALSLWGCSGDDDKPGPSCTSSADCGEGQVCFLPAGSSGIPTTGIPIEANQEDGSGDGSSSSGSSDGPGFCATSQQASSDGTTNDGVDNVDSPDFPTDLSDDTDGSCGTTTGTRVPDGDLFCDLSNLFRCEAGTGVSVVSCATCTDEMGGATTCFASESDEEWPTGEDFSGEGCYSGTTLVCGG